MAGLYTRPGGVRRQSAGGNSGARRPRRRNQQEHRRRRHGDKRADGRGGGVHRAPPSRGEYLEAVHAWRRGGCGYAAHRPGQLCQTRRACRAGLVAGFAGRRSRRFRHFRRRIGTLGAARAGRGEEHCPARDDRPHQLGQPELAAGWLRVLLQPAAGRAARQPGLREEQPVLAAPAEHRPGPGCETLRPRRGGGGGGAGYRCAGDRRNTRVAGGHRRAGNRRAE